MMIVVHKTTVVAIGKRATVVGGALLGRRCWMLASRTFGSTPTHQPQLPAQARPAQDLPRQQALGWVLDWGRGGSRSADREYEPGSWAGPRLLAHEPRAHRACRRPTGARGTRHTRH